MARFLHQHTDHLALTGIDYQDVVVDSLDEVLWRLRALGGLRNTRGSRIVAVGGAGGWGGAGETAPELARQRWQLDIQTVAYDELGPLIEAARQDAAAVARAREPDGRIPAAARDKAGDRAELRRQRLSLGGSVPAADGPGRLRAITVRGCMDTIMPLAQTTACLALSSLNDAGYLAFCEADFVAIPAGLLLGAIAGRPTFLNKPTYPHDGLITLAHCTAPRKMDGRTLEPARILTHFESDYGAAPKVEMGVGREVTLVAPDFAAKRWLGLLGRIDAAPFLPICRSQIDVAFQADSRELARRMPGFHWMLVYGNYLRETGYALKRAGIAWDCLRDA